MKIEKKRLPDLLGFENLAGIKSKNAEVQSIALGVTETKLPVCAWYDHPPAPSLIKEGGRGNAIYPEYS